VAKGTQEDESSTECSWAAGFHLVTARSRLTLILKIMNRLFVYFENFSDRNKPRLLNQWIGGHDCITKYNNA
jgi:hypothetical protein